MHADDPIQQIEVKDGGKYDRVLQYFEDFSLVTYPVLMTLVPGINFEDFDYWIKNTQSSYPIRKAAGKGYYIDAGRLQNKNIALQEMNMEFALNIRDRIETLPVYKNGYHNQIHYLFFIVPEWPSKIRKFAYVENNLRQFRILEFDEDSIVFEILAETISKPSHVITNLELARLINSFGDINSYSYSGIYKWFDYCRLFWKLQNNC